MALYSSQFPDPVCIVTVSEQTRSNAMSVGWASPISLNPSILMVSIAPQRYTHDMLARTREFGVSILSEDQVELSTIAGTTSGRSVDKLRNPAFVTVPGTKISVPLVAGARAWYECRLVDHHRVGDHTVFYGEVVTFDVDETKRPLVLFDGSYYGLGETRGSYSSS